MHVWCKPFLYCSLQLRGQKAVTLITFISCHLASTSSHTTYSSCAMHLGRRMALCRAVLSVVGADPLVGEPPTAAEAYAVQRSARVRLTRSL